MGEALKQRIRQSGFPDPVQEALLNILVTADFLRQQVERICTEGGITGTQYNVLRILRGVYPEGHPRCDIAERMIENAPDVTRIVDRLEAQGLVERSRSTKDRRLSLTRITPKGIEVLDRLNPGMEKLHQFVSERMSKKDCRELSRICEGIYVETDSAA